MTKSNKWIARKTGIWISTVGITIFLLNFITYRLWEIDIDILGALFIVLGTVMVIACGKSLKHSSEWFTRKNGVLICIIAAVLTALFGYSPVPVLNGDVGGFSGLTLFVLGLMLIAVRWNH